MFWTGIGANHKDWTKRFHWVGPDKKKLIKEITIHR